MKIIKNHYLYYFFGMLVSIFYVANQASAAKTFKPIPNKVGGYTLIGKKVYPDPSYGIQYRYLKNEGHPVDVYIYPVLESQRNNIKGAAWVEISDFISSIPLLESRGIYESASVLKKEKYLLPEKENNWQGYFAKLKLVRNGVENNSFLYVFTDGDTLIKVRLTSPVIEKMEKEIEVFVLELTGNIF